jgi:hypothetical protein
MDDRIGRKGFSFSDPVYINNNLEVSSRLTVGGIFRLEHSQFRMGSQSSARQAGMETYGNAIDHRWDVDNRIVLFDNGQVEFRAGGTSRHTFFPDGSKSGGSIEIGNDVLGMSPVDSPQVLIEYIEFDVALSPYGTKVMLDETYLKTVSSFAAFPNNGDVIEKEDDYIIMKGNGTADIRFVGERLEYENSFWADMKASRKEEEEERVMHIEAKEESGQLYLDGATGEMYRLRSRQ